MSKPSPLDTEVFDSLMSDVLEGQAAPDQVEQFNAYLREDARARQRYIAYIDLHAVLADPAGPLKEPAPEDLPDVMSELVEQALLARRQHEIEDHANRQLAADQAEEARERRLRIRPAVAKPSRRVIVIPKAAVWIGLAAMLGVAVWGWNLVSTPPPVDHTQLTPAPAPQAVVPAAPAPPAVLVASHRAAWGHGGGTATHDGALTAGAYFLEAGHVQVRMQDGASLIVEGPAEFAIESSSRVSIAAGVLSAYVPEGAEGFIVDTPAGRVLDLGTEFGIEVLDDQVVDVHVMQGRVVASLTESDDARSMGAGSAGRLDVAAAQIQTIPAHAQKFARDWSQVEQAIRVEGAARYLYDTPKSLRQGALEDDALFYILPERRRVTLGQDLLCNYTQPGRYDRVQSHSAGLPVLPAGRVVDSYLLHYDRIGAPLELVAVQGVIHFDRPVLAVLVDDRRLAATDAMFRNNQAQYPGHNDVTRGLEGLEHPVPGVGEVLQDVVEISDDRMTLTVNLETSTGIDQLRVLVEASP